jgi:heme-degrading monooxygenase HmoA
MYVIVWQYDVRPERRTEFESTYGSAGKWTDLFRATPGYVRTDLLRGVGAPDRYVTLDWWVNEEAFAAFIQTQREAYLTLDRETEELTASQTRLGALVPPA